MKDLPYRRGSKGEKVTVYEVGPRDGLQNVGPVIPSETKIEFASHLVSAGLPAVEVTSFVRPDRVLQLADGPEVFEAVAERHDPRTHRLPVLVPNEKGLDRAMECGVREIAVFTAATDTFSRKNTNASIQETLDRFRPVLDRALAADISVRGYVSVAFGCPYEGEVDPDAVLSVTGDLLELGCHEVSVGDTIGVAHPEQVREQVELLVDKFGAKALAMHFHDTRGTALANVDAALALGIRTFDASAGGLGGCPYAPGAAGNLATEDLLYLLEGSGYETGVDLDAVVRAGHALSAATSILLPGRVFQAIAAQESF
jgi:hydroxymethylglutaryl-CoA lyase